MAWLLGRDDPHADAGNRAVAGQRRSIRSSAAGTTAAAGELVQIDGSPHDWFEGRAPRCTLLVFVDDATSRIQAARFVAAETTAAYLDVMGEYIGRHGLPQAFYSDRHSIFRVNAAESAKSSLTQFGRALAELGIKASAPTRRRPRGRVEQGQRVLQDRLVKLMRLGRRRQLGRGQCVAEFLADYNARFGQAPGEPEDAHAPACPPGTLARHPVPGRPASCPGNSPVNTISNGCGFSPPRAGASPGGGRGGVRGHLNGVWKFTMAGHLPTRCWRLG